MGAFRPSIHFVFLLTFLLQNPASPAEMIAVRYPEGVSHGYLVLRTLDGKPIADGDSTQVARGDRVTNRMRFRFKDGSVYEQTTVFSQRGTFRLVSNRVLQKGPTFERPMETIIDATSGQVTVRYTEDGKEKFERAARTAPRCSQRYRFHLVKKHTTDSPENHGVIRGSQSKATAGEPRNHSTRPGTILGWQSPSQSDSLRRESENRRCSRSRRAFGREATSRHSSMGAWRGCPSLPTIRWSFVWRRPDLANGTCCP